MPPAVKAIERRRYFKIYNMRKLIKNQEGFSMIEVVAILLIIGIITAVAASNSVSTQQDLISQTDIAKSRLRFAQLKALNDDTATSWGIAFTGTAYTLYRNPALVLATNFPGTNSDIYTLPTGVTISNVSIDFNKFGSPLTGAASVVLTQNGVTNTINISNNTGFVTP